MEENCEVVETRIASVRAVFKGIHGQPALIVPGGNEAKRVGPE